MEKKIYSDWNKYSKDLLIKYCKKNNLGLIGFVRSFTVGKGYYANPVFNKFLFADFIKKELKIYKQRLLFRCRYIEQSFSSKYF